ncbi:MAG TPA: hypothetical protein VH814_21590 [Steroidobacteraceae bacterium]|jgi:hypothetical protein
MVRRTVWLVFSLFPVWAFVAILAHRDEPALAIWDSLLAAGVPGGIVEYLRSNWWTLFVLAVALHYCFFCVHPLFNRMLQGWKLKSAWAVSNFLFYPLLPPIYAWFGVPAHEAQT